MAWTRTDWLHAVVIQALVLCIAQVVCGAWAHSLALLSDSVHAAVDVITYLLALVTERLKRSPVLVSKRDKRMSRILDLAGMVFSIAFIVGASVYVTDEAAMRLTSHIHRITGRAMPVGEPDGRIMLGFSLVATLANLTIAYLYSKTESEGLKPKSTMERLHAVLHVHGPGCENCTVPLAGPADPDLNLNVLVQWLHVVMDAVRGLVMLVCSLLICLGVIDPSKSDAVLAIAVAVMVCVGFLGLLPKAHQQYRAIVEDEFQWDSSSAGTRTPKSASSWDEPRPSLAGSFGSFGKQSNLCRTGEVPASVA